MRIVPYLLSMTLLAVAGCASQIPYAESYGYTGQRKMQAVQHWRILAEEVAEHMREDMVAAGLADRPVYVVPRKNAAPFDEAFHDFLVEALIDNQVEVSRNAAGALILRKRVEVVSHGATRTYFPHMTMMTGVKPVNTEIIISCSLRDDEQFITKTANVFYINGVDVTHYVKDVEVTVAPKGVIPTPVRSMRLVTN